MEEVLQGVPNVVVYLDYILALSPSEQEHVKLLNEIVGIIRRKLQMHFQKPYLNRQKEVEEHQAT